MGDKATTRERTYLHYYRQHIVKFDVPIIGHLLMLKDEEVKHAVSRRNFMRWNGKSYDRKFLYTLRADGNSLSLKEYGPISLPLPSFPDRKISRLNANIRDCCKSFSDGTGFRLLHGRGNFNTTSTAPPPVGPKGILIDLRRPMCISHIGTMGEAPQVSVFPKEPATAARSARGRAAAATRQKWSSRKKARNGFVYTVCEDVSLAVSCHLACSCVLRVLHR